jgi:hypothetical protein
MSFQCRVQNIIYGLILLASLTLCTSTRAAALDQEKVKEFETAHANLVAETRPCLWIPYEGLRDDCIRKGEAETNSCKIVTWSCDGSNDTNPVLVDIKKFEERLDKLNDIEKSLKDDLSKAQDKKDEEAIKSANESIEKNKNEMSDLSFTIGRYKDALNERRDRAKKRAEFGKACLDTRVEVRKVFEEAASKADHEEEEDVKAIAEKLVPALEKSIEEHKGAIKDVQQGIKICEEMADRQSPR